MELRIFFRFRDRRDEWRKGACPLFFRLFELATDSFVVRC